MALETPMGKETWVGLHNELQLKSQFLADRKKRKFLGNVMASENKENLFQCYQMHVILPKLFKI